MCDSHRAFNPRGPVINQCAPCQQAATETKIAKSKSEDARLKKAYKAIKRLTRQMAAAGVPQQKLHHASTAQKTFFGRSRLVEDPKNHIFGWFVGEYEWIWYGEEEVEEECLTFLTADAQFVRADRPPARTVPVVSEKESKDQPWDLSDCPSRLKFPGEWRPAFMEEVLGKLTELARQHGIDPESSKPSARKQS